MKRRKTLTKTEEERVKGDLERVSVLASRGCVWYIEGRELLACTRGAWWTSGGLRCGLKQ